jgi:hypothetical protein
MTQAFEQAGREMAALCAQVGALADLVVITWANARGAKMASESNDLHVASPDARMTEYPEYDEYSSPEPSHSRMHRMWV